MIAEFLTRMLKSRDALVQAIETIERVLVSLDEEASRRDLEDPDAHGWHLRVEGYPVFVDLHRADDVAFLKVYSPVVRLPEDGILAFYRKLLEQNGDMLGVAFSVQEDTIFAEASRLIDSLSEDEVLAAVYGVAHYSVESVQPLVDEFGARPAFEADEN